MEESLNLSMEQRLQQRLSPLQVKFVKMLEMNGPEVEDEVQRALDDNPALETVDEFKPEAESDEFNESAEEMQLADYRNEDEIPSYRLEAHNHSVNDPYYEPQAVESGPTLMDSLMSQLAEYSLNEHRTALAGYIIGNFDDNGYLRRDLALIANDIEEQTGMWVNRYELKLVLNMVRKLDPAGVGAVDLRDCLLLQLRRRKRNKAVGDAIEIVSHYFDLFSKKHFDRLQSSSGLTADEVRNAMDVIMTLNPKPGGQIGSDPTDDRTRHIVPDFTVEPQGSKLVMTVVNNVPELQIEQTFSEEATANNEQSEIKEQREAARFARQKREEASEFIKLIKMRNDTLSQVMGAIVKLQHDFFAGDDDEMLIKPMILKDIAAITGLDLSVISRATAGKYVATPRGVYPLKMFFNERPKDDEDTSTREILAALRSIITAEDKSHPLSDEALTAALKDKGYDIARRTVAKYRERLGMPVARLRREL